MLNWPLQETLLNGCVALHLECHGTDLGIISIYNLGEILTWLFNKIRACFKCERELVRYYYGMLMTDTLRGPLYDAGAQKGIPLLGSV